MEEDVPMKTRCDTCNGPFGLIRRKDFGRGGFLPTRHAIEPASCDFEPSLCRHNPEIGDQKLGAPNSPVEAKDPEGLVSETASHLANPRECRALSCNAHMLHRDVSGFRLIPEHFGPETFRVVAARNLTCS